LAQLGHALDQRGIPDQALIDALAAAVWVTWAVLVASIAVEVPAALAGRRAPRLPLAGIFQPVTGRLVAAVIVAALSLAPRPTQVTALGSPGGGLSTAGGRQPVATLVLTGATRPLLATSKPAAADLSTPDVATASTNSSHTYVVQRGDTLWGIAERQLGDPLRWSEIYRLNEGRPQPDGRALTDPHWIDPGWTLVMPEGPTPTQRSSTPTTLPVTTTPTRPTTSPAPPAVTPTTAQSPSTAPRPVTPVPAGRAPVPTTSAAQETGTNGAPVRLPSGSVVAGSFVAGVLSAVALGRLRRRHAYRYRPPEPGRDITPEPLRPTLRHLAHPFGADAGHEDTSDPRAFPIAPFDDTDRRLDPGQLEVGTRDGATVTVETTDLSGIALCGQATDDIARALVASLLVRAGPGAAEVFLTARLAERLLPGLGPDAAIRRAKAPDDLARAVEAEMIARTRRFDAAEARDAMSYREANPENPLPLLVVFLDEVPDDSIGRWAALVGGSSRLGISVVFLGHSPAAIGRLSVDASRTVTDADPPAPARHLAGARLFGLRADEAVALLDAVADSLAEEDTDDDKVDALVDEPITVLHPIGQADEPHSTGEPWPEPFLVEEGQDRPIVVQMLGPFRITAHGELVATGLRSRAKALFAWYLVRPEGATSDEAVDALWPDTTPERVAKQFWRAFGDLRARLRGPGDEALDVLTKTGEHYQPCAVEIACDLWEFQTALADAARGTDDQARAALRQAVDTYRGDLLQGSDYPWVEPVRQDLHRRALDAHLRLAELEDHVGHPDAAADTLERAIDLDRYAEEPYRRLMALQGAHGRIDAVTTTWKLLHQRLGDLDLEVEPATTRLYRSLTTSAPDISDGAHPVRLSS
jgi:DNA-binding SARP family transcriptional activator/LysM repeat protein